MSLDAIAAISAVTDAQHPKPIEPTNHAKPDGFIRWLDDQVKVADSKIRGADAAVQDLVLGKSDNLHRVMMDVESARLSLDIVIQVRNRVVDAYQELMRMQI
jgi:flagellar hook-basal body complex protein FliE